MVKNLFKYFFILFIFFIVLDVRNVQARDVSIDNVVSFMNDNNLLRDSEYFYMFGKMLNGNQEYNIFDFAYKVDKEDNEINILVTLMDKEEGSIEKTITLSVEDNLISYTNTNDIDSLESRIATIIFSQLIYSVGGARGYNLSSIIDWMNQIDLTKITMDEGIEWTYQNVLYSFEQDGRTYEYEVSVPKKFTIDVNKLSDEMPATLDIEIRDITSDFSSVSMKVFAKNHTNEMCVIYRRNSNNEYEKVGRVSCNNGEFKDENLNAATTYFYQAIIEDKVMCSTEVKAMTSTNPNTGFFIKASSIVILIVLGVSFYVIYRKNSLFKRV